MKPFIITEHDPLNQAIVDELQQIANETGSKHAVRARAIALIIKTIQNPTFSMIARYFRSESLI